MRPGSDIETQITLALERSNNRTINYFDLPCPSFSILSFFNYMDVQVDKGRFVITSQGYNAVQTKKLFT